VCFTPKHSRSVTFDSELTVVAGSLLPQGPAKNMDCFAATRLAMTQWGRKAAARHCEGEARSNPGKKKWIAAPLSRLAMTRTKQIIFNNNFYKF
jgi:hypothetical protein